MLVFSTKLPIKDNITQEMCLNTFIEWITKSPHYSIEEEDIAYDISSHQDYDYTKDNITIHFRHYIDEYIELSACRLENREANAVWFNDCIFLNESGSKSLIVQLNCNRTCFDTTLPPVHKPYIVRKFVSAQFCRNDAGIPVVDYPLEVEDGYYNTCVKIMRGEHSCSMPSVYLSSDYWDETVIDPKKIAQKLGGVAHVFVEKKYDTAQKLRVDTNGNNVHTGYIGIYFPGTSLGQKHSLSYYNNNKRELFREVESSVWRALINRLDLSMYNWNQIIVLQSRQKMAKWQSISIEKKNELSEYTLAFDSENKGLRNQVEDLNQENYLLRAKYDALRASLDTKEDSSSCFYNTGTEPSLYDGEREDLLYSILSQVQSKYDSSSRAYVLIQSLLAANPRRGRCKDTIDTIREVFGNGGQLSKTDKAKLRDIGFTITENGPHYKITFHDPRYMFTVAKTPSENRGAKNMISDICKILDVEKKF